MMPETTARDAFEAMKMFIELGGHYEVNEDNTIISASSGNPVTITKDSEELPLRVLDENGIVDQNAVYLNIFSEYATSTSKELEWFYKATEASIRSIFLTSVLTLMRSKEMQTMFSADIFKKTAKDLEKIDEKAIKGFTTKCSTPGPFQRILKLFYRKSAKSYTIGTDLTEPDFRATMKNLGNARIDAFTSIISNLLEFNDDGVVEVESAHKVCPRLSALMRAAVYVIESVSDIMEAAELFEHIDVPKLEWHIDNIAEYQRLNSFFRSPNPTEEVATPKQKAVQNKNTVPVWDNDKTTPVQQSNIPGLGMPQTPRPPQQSQGSAIPGLGYGGGPVHTASQAIPVYNQSVAYGQPAVGYGYSNTMGGGYGGAPAATSNTPIGSERPLSAKARRRRQSR